ncbi:hypothetical protein AAG906_023692 [Vitis piasezkii]
MTLDIGNDALLCKVFPASLQGQTLSWFHRLPPNSVDNFKDLSEAFVGQYLCSARHKQNISTLQNIKMQDNESLREFVKRFGQAVLQRSICPGTPFFESLAKKPPTTMDDLFRRANKYSMLEDDVRLPKKAFACPTWWLRPLGTDPSKRDHSKRCAFHKEHGHTTETCRCLHYLVERLIKAGHLKQYLRSDAGGRDASQNHNSGAPRAPAAPKAVINYINGDPSDEEYDSKRKRQKLLRAASPHHDALILSLEIGDFDVRRILVDPGSSVDLVQASVVSHMGHSLTASKTLGESYPDSTGRQLPGPVTLNVQFSVVQDLSPFNVILGRTWLHYMKVIPSTYHQMVSFLTKDGQIDLYGSQLAARQCYQIARETGTSQEDASLPESSHARDQ